MPTIKEVSRHARVSPSTVSRVLNGTAPVNQETKKRVLDAVAQLNYHPNTFARGLVTNRSGGIGVVVNEISSPFYSGLISGIEQIVEAEGMHLLVSSGHAKAEKEREALEFLGQRRSDGLIFQVDASSDYDILSWLMDIEVPVVIVGRFIAEFAPMCLYLDNELGGYLATRHLIQEGHTKIAYVMGLPTIRDSWDRLHGYRRAIEEAGLPYDEMYVVEGTFMEESGNLAMRRLLERKLGITAVFLANDQMAAGAIQALRDMRLNVPDDISVIGYDDIHFAKYLYPALTTIRQPFAEMGRAAAKLLLAALNEMETEVKRKFEPELVIRQSVKRIG